MEKSGQNNAKQAKDGESGVEGRKSGIKVKCGVENCRYNKSRMCLAGEIEVNPMGNGHAITSDGTSCTTFIDKSGR